MPLTLRCKLFSSAVVAVAGGLATGAGGRMGGGLRGEGRGGQLLAARWEQMLEISVNCS